jgi:hypothetical protein
VLWAGTCSVLGASGGVSGCDEESDMADLQRSG